MLTRRRIGYFRRPLAPGSIHHGPGYSCRAPLGKTRIICLWSWSCVVNIARLVSRHWSCGRRVGARHERRYSISNELASSSNEFLSDEKFRDRFLKCGHSKSSEKKWYVHLASMQENNVTEIIMKYEPPSRRLLEEASSIHNNNFLNVIRKEESKSWHESDHSALSTLRFWQRC
jgi:hypothetical protein